MLHKPMKTVVFGIAMLFVMAGFALAAGQAGKTGHTGQTSETGKMGQTGQRMPGTTGMQAQDSISATVQDVDWSNNTLQLRTSDGETVDLKVPAGMMAELQKGDVVEVTIRKQQQGSDGSMGGTQPGTTGSGMQRQPGTTGSPR